MSVPIRRHFVTVSDRYGRRQVHYRRSGEGPAVLLLHQSPQSSKEMEPLMADWGRHFTLVAPDSPGYGWSDPLATESASLADFADATLSFADAIGLRRFGAYGFHTGASIAVTLADRHPQRLSALAANGLVALDDDEIAAILAEYLPPLTPRWDGSHLAWLWARLREQTIFFPWHDRSLATRMDFDVPPPERLQTGLLEFLAAGDHYHVAYRAAFAGHVERLLPRLTTPALITAGRRDPLATYLGRLADLPECVAVETSDDAGDALDRCRALLAAHPGDPCPTAVARSPGDRPETFYVGQPGRQILIRRLAEGAGDPVLIVHGPGASSTLLAEFPARMAPGRPVFALDLPGHGGSDGRDGPPLAGAVDATLEAMHDLGDPHMALAGVENGSLVALSAGARSGFRNALTLLDPPCWSREEAAEWRENGLPALTPAWHGGHLLECWHMVRDSRLFHPWFRRTRAGIRPVEPRLDECRLQAEVRDYLRSNGHWQALLDGLLSVPLREELRGTAGRVSILTSSEGSFARPAGNEAHRRDP